VLTGADFFCNTGMSIYSLRKANIEIEGVGKIGISDLLKTKSYGKVYVMLGINEISYSFNGTVKKYKALLDEIRETQPNADIYIQANLHVTKERSDKDQYVNNANLDKFNNAIAQFADNKTIFYIDPNEYFDDAEGNLSTEYCSDASHIRTKYYKEWSKWICTQVFVTE
ncbi:MAG: lipase, partial [Lachnospiraceae bacterium]|nr:lipase [Lachnospiraceae bacterium]